MVGRLPPTPPRALLHSDQGFPLSRGPASSTQFGVRVLPVDLRGEPGFGHLAAQSAQQAMYS